MSGTGFSRERSRPDVAHVHAFRSREVNIYSYWLTMKARRIRDAGPFVSVAFNFDGEHWFVDGEDEDGEISPLGGSTNLGTAIRNAQRVVEIVRSAADT